MPRWAAVYGGTALTFSFALGLTSCASPKINLAQHTTSTGTTMVGVVIAVRPIKLGSGASGSLASVNEVMLALQEPSSQAPLQAREFVIRRQDGNTATVVIHSLSSETETETPTPALAFAPGDQIVVIEGTRTELARRN